MQQKLYRNQSEEPRKPETVGKSKTRTHRNPGRAAEHILELAPLLGLVKQATVRKVGPQGLS
jgi:hypothetical protein